MGGGRAGYWLDEGETCYPCLNVFINIYLAHQLVKSLVWSFRRLGGRGGSVLSCIDLKICG